MVSFLWYSLFVVSMDYNTQVFYDTNGNLGCRRLWDIPGVDTGVIVGGESPERVVEGIVKFKHAFRYPFCLQAGVPDLYREEKKFRPARRRDVKKLQSMIDAYFSGLWFESISRSRP